MEERLFQAVLIGLMGFAVLTVVFVSLGDTAPVISVSSTGSVITSPDTYEVEFSIISTDEDSREAVAENAIKTNAVIKLLMNTSAKIESNGYDLSRVEIPPGSCNSCKPISTYQATNRLKITTTKLEEAGQLIELGTAAGVNQITNQHYTISSGSESVSRSIAINRALSDAQTQAEESAAALGKECGNPVRVTISGGRAGNYAYPAQASDSSEISTPVIPSDQEITVYVSCDFALV